MKLSIIAAMDKNRLIGRENSLPWRLRQDMKLFKEHTLQRPVIMGRKTFQSLPFILKDRINIVISKKPNLLNDFKDKGNVVIVSSISEALEAAKNYLHFFNEQNDEAFIIGGAEIYKQFLDKVDRLYFSEVEGVFEGDSFFPEIDFKKFKQISSVLYEAGEKDSASFCFNIYIKNQVADVGGIAIAS